MSLLPFIRGEGGRRPDEGFLWRLHRPNKQSPLTPTLSPRISASIFRDSLAGERGQSAIVPLASSQTVRTIRLWLIAAALFFGLNSSLWSQSLTGDAARVGVESLQRYAVRIVCGDDQSSGVIVADSGIVLTVAHGIDGQRQQVQLMTADGKQFEAKVLRRNEVADLAVLQILADAKTTFAAVDMVPTATIQKDDWVLAFGFPGRVQDLKQPIARLGRVIAIEKDRIRSSCALTTGDSGGPLLNVRGQLIGLHRQIGAGTDSNHHTTLAAAMRELAQIGFTPPRLIGAGNAPEVLPSAKLIASEAVSRELKLRTVRITVNGHDSPIILGTAIDASLVATKLSELPQQQDLICIINDQQIAAKFCATDLPQDLAILELSEPMASVSLPSISDASTITGTVIFSLNSASQPIAGMIGRTELNEPAVTGRIGARLKAEPTSSHVTIEEVLPNGAAASAGFKSMDQIITINHEAVKTLKELAVALRPFQPGDRIPFELKQPSEDPRLAVLRLQHDVSEKFEKTNSLTADPVPSVNAARDFKVSSSTTFRSSRPNAADQFVIPTANSSESTLPEDLENPP